MRNSGQLVYDTIRPGDTADTFPTHEAKYGKGGLRTVASLAERDAITVDRREVGMLVYVTADSTMWQLGGDLETWSAYQEGSAAAAALAADLASNASGKGASLVKFEGSTKTVEDLTGNGSGEGGDLVAHPDLYGTPYLKTVSDILNGIPVSVLRLMPRTLHSAIRDYTSVADVGAYLQVGFDDNIEMHAPSGRYNIEQALTMDNNIVGSSDPFSPNQYDGGLHFIGAGMNRTQLINRFSAAASTGANAQGVLNLRAVVQDKYRLGGNIRGFTIFGDGVQTNTHGILMNSNFHGIVEQVRVQSMPGAALYSPERTDIGSNPDRYQNSVLQVRNSFFNACEYGVWGQSGLGMAATAFDNCFFYNHRRSGARVGGVLMTFRNCAFAVNGASGSLAGVDTCGLIIDTIPGGGTNRNTIVENCEFESNFNANIWVRSAQGFLSRNLRLNSQISPDGGTTLNAPVQVLLGDTGTALRSCRFEGDVSKSPPSGTGSTAALSMYKLRGTDIATTEIWEPVGIAGSDNTSAFVLLDTTTTTGALDGVRMIRSGLKSSTRSWSQSVLLTAYNSANQVIPTGVTTTMVFDTELSDNAAAFVPATGIFTVPSAGFYRVRYTCRTQAPAATTVILSILKGVNFQEKRYVTEADAFEHYDIEDVINCAAGDTIRIQLRQDSGGNMTFDGGLAHNRLIIERVD